MSLFAPVEYRSDAFDFDDPEQLAPADDSVGRGGGPAQPAIAPDAVGILPVRTLPPFNIASPVISTLQAASAPDAIGSLPDRTAQVSVPTVPTTSTDVLTEVMTPPLTSMPDGTPAGAVAATVQPPHVTGLLWLIILAVAYYLLRR